ncbi:uncharacterized protein LOC109704191 isoform X2 [Ananas comosus]|uniref:Uncharacterized protein LOC109704191 isoform X2 n=1 Tax=Ananas comosus TaxID=4615 RepID=A0A6P5EGE8_ANACO|nr:uncharacterized protein LOC109704191 isoform X2 [Ananas comosus]
MFSKLSFIVRLLQIKCQGGWSNKSFDMLLELLKQMLPEGETLPESFYETNKIMKDLGLGYEKIDACPNDCILYRKEFANASSCHVCGASRWKVVENKMNTRKSKAKHNHNVPMKVLRYFPLKSSLQRLFMSSKTASEMRWHNEGRTKDGILRHPADSPAWKDFDHKHQQFSFDPRNVRLGLASDGFNPFRMMSISHSTWPVILIPYNLPPWICMKQSNLILSLLIPGSSALGNDIDVYMQPLIDELKELWIEGVKTYDVSCGQTFQMRAAILWTISDFSGYACLSGWSTKGHLACPYCNNDTCSKYLKHGRKLCYMGHRRFLKRGHRFRQDAISFDGTCELREAPPLLSGHDLLEQVKDINIVFGKHNKNTKSKKSGRANVMQPSYNWKKRSIFFDLPYWDSLLVRHNLDVMHIVKNISDNVLYTLINFEDKSKDNFKARLDLQEMGLRHDLHPVIKESKTYLPPASFSLSKEEKDIFFKVLKGVKFPDGYAANISSRIRVKERKISGLKSHDSYVLMLHLLPLAIRRILPRDVCSPLIELSNFFRELCSKSLKIKDIDQLEDRIALTLCHLESIFQPAFFDIMVHLAIHLANEAKLAGPVQYRWMFPIERKHLDEIKVHNRRARRHDIERMHNETFHE